MPLFVLDPAIWGPSGANRRAYLSASLADLGERVGGLQLRSGDPVDEVLAVANAAGATTVHVAADFNPHGRERDSAVERALAAAGIQLVRTGSPYAVPPGQVTKDDGTPYAVYTPYRRAWESLDRSHPVAAPSGVEWLRPLPSEDLPVASQAGNSRLPSAGEQAAHRRWSAFLDDGIDTYDADRSRPDLDRTSRMSVHLKWGEIHPRTLLADLAKRSGDGARTYRRELVWREFYADVLWRRPDSARQHLRPQLAGMHHDPPGPLFEAWTEGRTGFPIVDAGMRQLRSEGWMHNRLRMIVASFLVKDLHVDWRHGAQHFHRWLVDADLASNNHGWQWVAGSGTDPAPYYRVFNPVKQGRTFDPDGSYVRRHVDELAAVSAPDVHEPWSMPGGPPAGYPMPIVDHNAERLEALARYQAVRSG